MVAEFVRRGEGLSQMSTGPCYVQRIGLAVPERTLSVDESSIFLKDSCTNPRSAKLVQRIARLTGIEKRHLAALDHQSENASDSLYRLPAEQPRGPGMADRTAAFEKSAGPLVLRALNSFPRQTLSEVDTLVTVSCTHASSPGIERPILTHTPVPATAHRWNLGFMGCSAALAAMRLVHQRGSPTHSSLIVACELSSLHFQYTEELDQMTANLLFADGAAAMTLGPRPTSMQVLDCQSHAIPSLADQMVWFAGDHGLQLRLSQTLPDTLATHLPRAVDVFLQRNELNRERVDHWLVHPGGTQILASVEQSLGLSKDALRRSWSIYRKFGNMSSPTILFILKDILESDAEGIVVAMAFGPGLTIELALLRVDRRAGTMNP